MCPSVTFCIVSKQLFPREKLSRVIYGAAEPYTWRT